MEQEGGETIALRNWLANLILVLNQNCVYFFNYLTLIYLGRCRSKRLPRNGSPHQRASGLHFCQIGVGLGQGSDLAAAIVGEGKSKCFGREAFGEIRNVHMIGIMKCFRV